MARPISNDLLQASIEAYHAAGDNQVKAAKALGIKQNTLSDRIREARTRGMIFTPGGAVAAMSSIANPLPPKGKVARYLLTCAQDHTAVEPDFWNNLLAMRKHYKATLYVSTFRYNKTALGQSKSAKGNDTAADLESAFDAKIIPYICDDRIDLAPNLTFCGELQISPTARRPLSGFENYTYRKSTIVPHTTLAMRSVAAAKGEGVKLLYTTGACSKRNYIKRKEGFRAEHFHAYGALLVEVDSEGRWYCRNVEQGEDGTLRDLNLVFKKGELVTDFARVECITWGDIHASKLDPDCAKASWGGPGSMLDVLEPKHQHLHDLLDCTPFSHHTRKDPFEVYRNYVHANRSNVVSELMTTAKVAGSIIRPWCRTVVVNANHDRHLERFLKEVDWRDDPENAETILELTRAALAAIRTGDDRFNLVEHAIGTTGVNLKGLVFLHEDESDVILPKQDGGIECGIHGDRGLNGARGTPSGFARMGRKVNIADKHTAERIDLVCVAGVSGLLDMGFNKGPSSWTHSHIVTYPNGCRTIIGVWRGKWHA